MIQLRVPLLTVSKIKKTRFFYLHLNASLRNANTQLLALMI